MNQLCTTIRANALKMPVAAIVILAASAGILATALIAQFVFGHKPCVLCLWQRVPYVVTLILAAAALFLRPYSRIFLGICAAVFLAGVGLSIFHTGVELHWWLGTSGCAIHPLHGGSVADLREQLLGTEVARCDQITWTFLGLSFANWNVLTSLILAIFSGMAAGCRKVQ